ncbi:MAG TPA: hypothetical protein VK735_37090, partial [Pseudonocardia sp.]|uniref:hypothetical protein n=1 Tax=Pseudonocardia sp. TaxID=60912 RepID=UPI002CBE264F
MSVSDRPQLDFNHLGDPREQLIIVLVRTGVVISWAVLMAAEPQLAQPHRPAAWALLAVSA